MNNVGKDIFFPSACSMHDRGPLSGMHDPYCDVKILLQIPSVI